MKKIPKTNKTIILSIVCTLIVSLFFGAIVYAFNDRPNMMDKPMEMERREEDSDGRMEDQRGDLKDNQGRSNEDSEPNDNQDRGMEPNDGTDSKDNSRGRFNSNEKTGSIGEIKSIEGNTLVLEVKSINKDSNKDGEKPSDETTEEKSYTVSSDIDLSSFAAGDTVKYETDDNNQITSLEKVSDHRKSEKQEQGNDDSEQKEDQSKVNFSANI